MRKEMGPINQEFLRVLSIFLVLLTSGIAEALFQDQILIVPFTWAKHHSQKPFDENVIILKICTG